MTNTNTVQSGLSKWFCEHLTSYTNEAGIFNFKNSWELKEKLKLIKMDKNDALVSFDVVSLFTCIPRKFIHKILKSKWNQIKKFFHKKYDMEFFFLEVLGIIRMVLWEIVSV